MKIKGINYNAGIDYDGKNSNNKINMKELQSDFEWIKKLNCNAIRLYGSDNNKLLKYSEYIKNNGFKVFISPRYIGLDIEKTLEILSNLSKKLTDEVLIIGNEITIDMKGLVNGENYLARAKNRNSVDFGLLNNTLKKMVENVKKYFDGKILYASLVTENIDYTVFDYIGWNYYWYLGNMFSYKKRLKKIKEKYKKEIIITEFGTCPYTFSSLISGASYYPVEVLKIHQNRFLSWLIRRDENEQVRFLKKSLKIFDNVDVYGSFVFDFAEKWKTYYPNKKSLELGSFGLMRTKESGQLEPQKSFYFLSNYYKSYVSNDETKH